MCKKQAKKTSRTNDLIFCFYIWQYSSNFNHASTCGGRKGLLETLELTPIAKTAGGRRKITNYEKWPGWPDWPDRPDKYSHQVEYERGGARTVKHVKLPISSFVSQSVIEWRSSVQEMLAHLKTSHNGSPLNSRNFKSFGSPFLLMKARPPYGPQFSQDWVTILIQIRTP